MPDITESQPSESQPRESQPGESQPGGAAALSQPTQDLFADDQAGVVPSAQQSSPGPSAAGTGKPAIAAQAKERMAGALVDRKDAVADGIENVSQTVRRSGEQFAGQQDWIASAIGRGADELSALADALRAKDLGSLANEVQTFAARSPAIFIGSALAAGFAVARVGKLAARDASRADLPEVRHG